MVTVNGQNIVKRHVAPSANNEEKKERRSWLVSNPESLLIIDKYGRSSQAFLHTKSPSIWIQACQSFYNIPPIDQQAGKQFRIRSTTNTNVTIYIYNTGTVQIQGNDIDQWTETDLLQINNIMSDNVDDGGAKAVFDNVDDGGAKAVVDNVDDGGAKAVVDNVDDGGAKAVVDNADDVGAKAVVDNVDDGGAKAVVDMNHNTSPECLKQTHETCKNDNESGNISDANLTDSSLLSKLYDSFHSLFSTNAHSEPVIQSSPIIDKQPPKTDASIFPNDTVGDELLFSSSSHMSKPLSSTPINSNRPSIPTHNSEANPSLTIDKASSQPPLFSCDVSPRITRSASDSHLNILVTSDMLPPSQSASQKQHDLEEALISANCELAKLQNAHRALKIENNDLLHRLDTKDVVIESFKTEADNLKLELHDHKKSREKSNDSQLVKVLKENAELKTTLASYNKKYNELEDKYKASTNTFDKEHRLVSDIRLECETNAAKIQSLLEINNELSAELEAVKGQKCELLRYNSDKDVQSIGFTTIDESGICSKGVLYSTLLKQSGTNSSLSTHPHKPENSIDRGTVCAQDESLNETEYITIDEASLDAGSLDNSCASQINPNQNKRNGSPPEHVPTVINKGNENHTAHVNPVSQKKIDICYTKNQAPYLSMFYPEKVQFKGKVYRSCEHAYQSQKAIFSGNRFGYAEQIENAQNATEAKNLAKKLLPYKSGWRLQKVAIVKDIVKARYKQSPSFAKALHGSGDSVLVHNVPDSFWGCGKDGNGANKYGDILTELRNTSSLSSHGAKAKVESSNKAENCYFICDSMGKGVNLNTRNRKNLTISYPNAGISYVSSRIDNIIGKAPPTHIAVMVGTNDIQCPVDQILSDYDILTDHLLATCPNANITVCGIESRADLPKLNDKIYYVNRSLASMCRRKTLQYTPTFAETNPQIDWSIALGRKGVHLNGLGKTDLSKRIINSFRSNQIFQHPHIPPLNP